MIYGYDKKNNIFYVADHFKYGKYSFEVCSFEEINSAFAIHMKQVFNDLEYTRFIQLIKPDINWIRNRYYFASEKERKYMSSFNIVSLA
ncbi:hypothetical protein [Clostridium beijerinckii]|uniref:hypothetical protein n=1 Tax=Clostridium beijerinckii TaxID=1520 RepID=UPI0022DFEE01|nr:hypothetical protein [Clostridium beijerinckii]